MARRLPSLRRKRKGLGDNVGIVACCGYPFLDLEREN